MLIFFFFLLLPAFVPSQGCHPDDQAALFKIKNSFSNPDQLLSWSPQLDCCDFGGVGCANNRVNDLEITYSSLSGTIPDAIAELPYLQTLRLHKMPSLIGEIPPSIAKLENLLFLEISWTNITGRIPPFLGKLKNLEFLYLNFNQLSGPIPSSLATLSNIEGIDLSRNKLTGSIPESFGHFPPTASNPSLTLSHNMLSGKIPLSLAITNFSRVDISRNNFSGDASMFFGASKATNIIDISRNNFEFDFSGVTFSLSLDLLDISHNRIYGSINEQITDAIFLQQLNVSYNRMCGEIPTGWKLHYRTQPFDNTSYLHNRCLCGTPLPPCKP